MINVTRTFLPPAEEYLSLLTPVWESGWVTNRGVLVTELESRLRDYLQIDNILIVNNGTIALQLAIRALNLSGEIITTPFSYVATVSSIVWEQCQPVFVDIEPVHLTIDESKIEEAVTGSTKAILATHVYGNPCAVREIEEIAKRHNLAVIYDAAHCFGVRYQGESLLRWGDVSTLSFHATKLFHTGEGGAITSNNRELDNRIYYMHNFGHNGPEEFFGVGINGKISELNAAMGLAVLPYMERLIGERKHIYEEYSGLLQSADIELIHIRENTEWNYSYFPVLLPTESHLQKVKQALNENDIFPRRYFYPSLNNLPYTQSTGICQVAENVSRRVLCLPVYAGLEDESVERISSLITGALSKC
jgi:dTDP-4-amino-4,6-dideoxygalactose transaminase